MYVLLKVERSMNVSIVVFIVIRLAIRCIFFFQAEDGIRDHCVTGVQTCALPIYIKLLAGRFDRVIADGVLKKYEYNNIFDV